MEVESVHTIWFHWVVEKGIKEKNSNNMSFFLYAQLYGQKVIVMKDEMNRKFWDDTNM